MISSPALSHSIFFQWKLGTWRIEGFEGSSSHLAMLWSKSLSTSGFAQFLFLFFFFGTLSFSPYLSFLCSCQNDLPQKENLIPIPLLTILHRLCLPPRKKFRGSVLKISSVFWRWWISQFSALEVIPFPLQWMRGSTCVSQLPHALCREHYFCLPWAHALPALSSSLFTWLILTHLGWRMPSWHVFSKLFLLPPCPASRDWKRWPSYVLLWHPVPTRCTSLSPLLDFKFPDDEGILFSLLTYETIGIMRFS